MVNSLRLLSSRNIKLFALVMLAVIGISSIAPQKASANVYTTSNGKSCKQRTFSAGSQSVCVSYIISLINASGKVSKADQLTPGVNFGPKTKAVVKQYQSQWASSPDGIVSANAKTWAMLCSQGKSNGTVWTKAGCGGQDTATYRSKPTGSAANNGYRWGYFNCYPTSKMYPAKPVWACESKWVDKKETINTNTSAKPIWAIKSAQTNVKQRYNQFQLDMTAYNISKAYHTADYGTENGTVHPLWQLRNECLSHNGYPADKNNKRVTDSILKDGSKSKLKSDGYKCVANKAK